MGGQDTYCAICGGPLSRPFWDEQEEETRYDPDLVVRESPTLQWLADVRLIGENPSSLSLNKVYITGLAEEDDHGMFDIERGSDPNVPDNDDSLILWAYGWESDISGHPVAFPFHIVCYDILRKSMGEVELDKAILYDTFKAIGSIEDYDKLLAIKYDRISKCQDQYWCSMPGTEDFVLSPIDIPRLNEYYRNLPQLSTDGLKSEGVTQSNHPDPFARLAPETLLSIISFMDLWTLLQFRAASRGARNLELTNSFWKLQRRRDMPWLFDFPRFPNLEAEDAVNWPRVYKELYVASTALSQDKIHGLVNRRRIWELQCPQISQHYAERKVAAATSASTMPALLLDALSTPSRRLLHAESKRETSSTSALLKNYADLPTTEPILRVSWTTAGLLAEFQAQKSGRAIDQPGHAVDQVEIPRNDWFTGVVVTTREGSRDGKKPESARQVVGLQILFAHQSPIQLGQPNGDKLLIYVSNRHFAVGLQTIYTSEQVISNIILLQQPKANALGSERLNDNNSSRYNFQAASYLWRNELPPPALHVSSSEFGYWSSGRDVDVSPCEALVFGETNDELADITDISADVQMGGFEVRYANRPPRAIGPRMQAMRTLQIDGQGGERIVAVYHIVRHIPISLRFVTNYNRQLVIGQAATVQDDNRSPAAVSGGFIPVLAGVHGWWSPRQSPKANLDRIGCFYLDQPTLVDEDTVQLGALDEYNAFCDPEPAPASMTAHGEIWGPIANLDEARSHQNLVRRYRTLPGNTVYWLDCSRPLMEVRVTLCHSTNSRHIPLSALTFVYADDGGTAEASAGPSHLLAPPTDVDETTGQHWCWCQLGSRVVGELEARPHYNQHKWNVGSKRLKALRIWLSDGELKDIVAMQMVAEGGRESPIWGVACEAPATTETPATHNNSGNVPLKDKPSDGIYHNQLDFVPDGSFSEITFKEGETDGLKLYFASNNRHTTRDDMVLTGIQTLKKTS